MTPEPRRPVAGQSYGLQETVTDPFFRCVNRISPVGDTPVIVALAAGARAFGGGSVLPPDSRMRPIESATPRCAIDLSEPRLRSREVWLGAPRGTLRSSRRYMTQTLPSWKGRSRENPQRLRDG